MMNPSILRPSIRTHLDEPADDLRGVFGELLYFPMQDEGDQDVLLVSLQHDMADSHGGSGNRLDGR